jgi:hypothetical protein
MPFEVMLRGTNAGAPVERRSPFRGRPTLVIPLEMSDVERVERVELRVQIYQHDG